MKLSNRKRWSAVAVMGLLLGVVLSVQAVPTPTICSLHRPCGGSNSGTGH